jgi:beta-glucosidase
MKLPIVPCVIALAGCAVLGGCKRGCGQQVEKVNAYKPAPNAHSAVIGVPQTTKDWWMPRHLAILERVRQGNVDLVFIGDSITHRWEEDGKEVWNNYYGTRNAVNMGFSGDRTQNVLWRLEHGEITGISPKLVILMIGTNNNAQVNGNSAIWISATNS